jgi:hypothetical protein
MVKCLLKQFIGLIVVVFFSAAAGWAQTGKISGQVIDASTGDPLPGVNVVIDDEQQGATTNAQGNYTILNVSPGTYTLRATFVGYAEQVIENVEVNIDLTTTVNIQMQEEAVGLDEVVVRSETPVVQPDISANVSNLNAENMENMPVTSVEDVLNLQAGVEPGLQFRGGGQDELRMTIDGMSLRDGRDNAPYTGISYTSVKEMQVQTGGFNAEYGNVRSGLINVVTKDAPRNRYTVDVLSRYIPPQKKHFGIAPLDPDAYYMRPYLDPDVALEGTNNGAWDRYTADQYPHFEGWNQVAEDLREDGNPSNDLTPEQLQEMFRWTHRKDTRISVPDYEVDASFGGPIPGISERLGDLRFFASVRQQQSAYIVPQVREAYVNRTGQLKVTSDLSSSIRLRLQGLYGNESGMHAGFTSTYRGENPPYPWSGRGMVTNMGGFHSPALISGYQWPLKDVTRHMMGTEVTHTLGANTFYKLNVQRLESDYFSRPPRLRDTSTVRKEIGPMQLDEAPMGYIWWHESSPVGPILGRRWAKARDSSNVTVWTSKFDITSQLNQYAQVKAGIEFMYSDYDMNFGSIDKMATIQTYRINWNRRPIQGASYLQSKLEFEGMIANVGVRLDYFDGNGDWYKYDPYTRAFTAQQGAGELDEALESEPVERQVYLSPRLGISFPITADSKFYFNYGHFRQMLDPNQLYKLRSRFHGDISEIGNPNHPMPQTIAYELGYEHNIFNQFLLRLTGYYKDITDQPRSIYYESLDGVVNYTTPKPYNYEDIRGLEVTLRKNAGRWFRGFLNYSYMVNKGGVFGLGRQYENRAQQRQYERQSGAWEFSATPEPYARFNLEFFTPVDFGPEAAGLRPAGDWRLSFLGNWRAGQKFTWTAGRDARGVDNNVSWRNYYMVDLRLAKNIDVGVGDLKLFADIDNLFNIKHLYRYSAFEGDRDFEKYMNSLHLPENAFEGMDNPPTFIPGDDEPGDFRNLNTEYVPIEIVGSESDLPNEVTGLEPDRRVLHYLAQKEQYMEFVDGSWKTADGEFVEEVLENKKYINMPNARYFTFLNPRRVRFGVRFSF